MKTIFNKIYVISLITNKEKQEFIKYQFNELNLDFEFIYGIDYYNLTLNYNGDKITYPKMHNDDVSEGKIFGSSIGHYFAVLQAYEFGYNNVLVIEDDVCFIKDKKLIEYYFNNVPQDADFITFDPRFVRENEYDIIYNKIKESKDTWLNISFDIKGLIGAMLYGIMNRNAMKLYIENQHNRFKAGDHVNGFFDNPSVNRYVGSKCLCTDQYNIETNFNTNFFYNCIYHKIDNNITTNLFYTPAIFFH